MAEFENDFTGTARDGRGAERVPIPFRTECAEDYVLPDYMGDVKRILRGAARVIPISKLVSDSGISVLATVCFRTMTPSLSGSTAFMKDTLISLLKTAEAEL